MLKRVLIISGLSIVFIAWLIGYWGFVSFSRDTEVTPGQIKVACVGDSITYGTFVKNWYQNSYPEVLGQLLGAKFNVRNYGVSGRTGMKTGDHPYILESRYQQSLEFKPDIVVIMFGTNDSKSHNWQGVEEFTAQYKELISSYLESPSNPLVYLMAPPATFHGDKNAYDISEQVLQEIRKSVRALGTELDLPVIELDKATAIHADWFVYDGIHTNEKGAAGIAQTVYSAITARH